MTPNMLLAYNASRIKANAPPPMYGNLVVEANMDNTEVWIDGRDAGVVSKDKPLRLPGISPGAHQIKGVHMGYEPDGPREEQVYPGQDTTVTIRLLIARRPNHAAVDEFDKGMEFYNKGFQDNYKKAAEHFEKAIQIDPKYSKAYLYLGRVDNALFEDQKAQVARSRRRLQLDPDYLEARASYGGALLDSGNLDESIRQLNRGDAEGAGPGDGMVSAVAGLLQEGRLCGWEVGSGECDEDYAEECGGAFLAGGVSAEVEEL